MSDSDLDSDSPSPLILNKNFIIVFIVISVIALCLIIISIRYIRRRRVAREFQRQYPAEEGEEIELKTPPRKLLFFLISS